MKEIYGAWTIIGIAAPSKDQKRRYTARCVCGKVRVVHLRHLESGASQSCGCQHLTTETHGHTIGGQSPEYTAWLNMNSRCSNPYSDSYPNYGGRGITVCAEWEDSFQAFYSYLGPRPSPKHSLDRIDNNGPYAPGNVRWATEDEQRRNKRIKSHVGERFGNLCITGIGRLRPSARSAMTVTALCDCGRHVEVNLTSLRYGKRMSCGCLGRPRETQAPDAAIKRDDI